MRKRKSVGVLLVLYSAAEAVAILTGCRVVGRIHIVEVALIVGAFALGGCIEIVLGSRTAGGLIKEPFLLGLLYMGAPLAGFAGRYAGWNVVFSGVLFVIIAARAIMLSTRGSGGGQETKPMPR